ncbi:hypothetical protein GEOBRER4_n0984 [Citrifermentans bremense]|uniref:Uncharacterized protein n=1 Tax=Citrifermentans bremense TaxID=60035 RepID=A0A7R7FRY3_9BACT|nr:hypothetical protein GEOBRER4_n0984 [Citrifermentans bremense]
MYRYRLKNLLLAATLIPLAGCSHAMQARKEKGKVLEKMR